VKARTKFRDIKRTRRKETVLESGAAEPAEGESEADGARRIYHVDHLKRRKPMTLDEAVLEMDKDLDYLVYRDSETDRVSVLVRRRDGHFDLIQA